MPRVKRRGAPTLMSTPESPTRRRRIDEDLPGKSRAEIRARLRTLGRPIANEAPRGIRRARNQPMLNLAVILEDTARASPLKTAFAFGDKRFSFKEINQAASRVANALKAMGVEPGDRVAVSCPNLPYFPMVMFGILKAGAVFTPLNILLKPQEIAYHLADSGAKVYFCFEGSEALPMGDLGARSLPADAELRTVHRHHRRPGCAFAVRGRADVDHRR